MKRWILACVVLGIACGAGDALAAPAWQSLFNGKDLAGWKPLGPETWRIEDGALVGETKTGAYGWLVSEKEYGDFVLRVRFKWEGGNSGIQFRSKPEGGMVHGYQADLDPNVRGWIGGLYDEGDRGSLALAPPEIEKIFRRDAWNDYEVSAIGEHIRLSINGFTTVDIRDKRLAKGIIALQIHSGQGVRVRWKDLRILEVPKGVDWQPIFDGKSLAGWKPLGPETWKVEDGAIVGETKTGAYGWLVSEKEYGDFVLRLRFKWEGGNSGIQFRSKPVGEHVHGYQADIDPDSPRVTGMLYEEGGRGMLVQAPAEVDKVFLRDGWNDYEISAIGERIHLFVNGLPTADIRDGRAARGIIALQTHSGQGVRLRWKDIRILDLGK